jgi:hypothetical protein
MKLKLVLNKPNRIVHLLNVDAIASDKSSNRCLASWHAPKGKNLRCTTWNNDMISPVNPYRYNRVNVHYTNENGQTVTTSYYCISEVIELDDISFDNFDDSVIT